MARYSSFKYSDEKYGGSTPTEGGELSWILAVDWDGDGIYEANEAAYMVDYSLERGRKHYLQNSGGGFENMPAGKAVVTLENKDRRFDKRNISSPIYEDIAPGKRCQIRVKINATGAVHLRLTGYIQDIRPVSGNRNLVRMEISDYGGILDGSECSSSASAVRVSLDAAIIRILEDLAYPGPRRIDTDAQPVIMLDAAENNGLSLCNQLAHSVLGTFFIASDGGACFYNRSHTGNPSHSLAQAQLLKEILRSQPWDDLYNRTTVIVHRPIKEQPSVIWSNPNPKAVSSGTPATIYIKYSPATDFAVAKLEANTLANGDGTNISDDMVVTTTSLSYGGGYLVITPGANGYITALEIRGRSFQTIDEEYTYNNTGLQAGGITRFALNNPLLQDPHYGASFAASLGAYLDNERDTIQVKIQDRSAIQYPIDLLDEIELTIGTLDIDAESYYVQGISEEWNSPTGQDVTTIIHLHDLFFDDTAISAAPVEEIAAPLGLKNPAGDPDTNASNPDSLNIPVYHNDTLVGNAKELNFLDSDYTPP